MDTLEQLFPTSHQKIIFRARSRGYGALLPHTPLTLDPLASNEPAGITGYDISGTEDVLLVKQGEPLRIVRGGAKNILRLYGKRNLKVVSPRKGFTIVRAIPTI